MSRIGRVQEGHTAMSPACLVVENNTPATSANNVKMIEAIHKAGDKFCNFDHSPLQVAIQKADIPMIKALRSCGAVYRLEWVELAQSKDKDSIIAALENLEEAEKRMAHFKDAKMDTVFTEKDSPQDGGLTH
ncbi:TPA: hypothetical protein U2K22_003057 [Legionella pneumophila]|nr:hypothetical protein [Legionella pneumophila]HEM6992010.1 hypothetical protein [Legionella pneumophila]HEM7051926.1 hypothetical protein [Legionella pneumophila]HEM7061452.1 hypothetical protein [Legionella pneumophila]HEM7077480.1 hypothetical protein [Legionella pneumophila]